MLWLTGLLAQGGNDKVFGYDGDDDLDGGEGNDIIQGGNGNDFLGGGAGADKLLGGFGVDALSGGAGKDTLTGDAGIDTFYFNAIGDSVKGKSRDVITDFLRSDHDLIGLEGIDANTHKAGDQKFHFIGHKDFGEKSAQLRFEKGIVSGDVNGDGKADFEIGVDVAKLTKGDFVL